MSKLMLKSLKTQKRSPIFSQNNLFIIWKLLFSV